MTNRKYFYFKKSQAKPNNKTPHSKAINSDN